MGGVIIYIRREMRFVSPSCIDLAGSTICCIYIGFGKSLSEDLFMLNQYIK